MRTALLRDAERLLRTRGYADFSYADLAAASRISKASVHHYFPTKAELASVLVREYVERFEATLAKVARQSADIAARLEAYGQLFLAGFEQGMLPLCGALAAERAALPEPLRDQVTQFFKIHLRWLERILREAVANDELPEDTPIERTALRLLSAIEGGSITSWALQDFRLTLRAFEDVTMTLLGPRPASRKRIKRPRS